MNAEDKTAFWDVEIARIEGELAVREDGAAVAIEASFERSLSISRRQKARALELLSPVHAWFTEGLDAPDLQNANALLDAIS